MGVEGGDDLLIIGGGSRKSRIFKPDLEDFNTIWNALISEEGGANREETLETIRDCGFEPGNPGKNGEYRQESEESEPSQAATLQTQAERQGMETLTHMQRRKVANRLLQMRGLEESVEWFREQFGDDFKEDITRSNLEGLCDEFDDLPDV